MANPFVQEPVPSGEVLIHTSFGHITVELWCKECPKACRNFIQLCLEGYYDGVTFHRIVPDFIAQTGDPTGTGTGGECIYDEPFADEINQRMRFSRRGLVAMANTGQPNSNTSQFFFTLDRADALQNKHTIFGRVASDRTIFNLLKLNAVELEPGTERPVYPPTIKTIDVVTPFFTDIVPRLTAAERKEQLLARKEARQRARGAKGPKRKGAKDTGLLSFAEEGGDEASAAAIPTKFKSAHDVEDESGLLSRQVIDDRGLSAQLPASFADMPTAKRKEERTPSLAPVDDRKPAKRPKVEKAPEPSEAEKRKAEIAAVSDSLRKRESSADAEKNGKKGHGPPKPSALALERAMYAQKAPPSAKTKASSRNLDDILSSFRGKVRTAIAVAPAMASSAAYEGEILELDEGDLDAEASMPFLGHELKFRKDATMDVHRADEYTVHDPLAQRKEGFTLQDAKAEEDRRRRAGLAPGAAKGGKGRPPNR